MGFPPVQYIIAQIPVVRSPIQIILGWHSDYGMEYMWGGVVDRVELTVSVEGVQRK